MRDSAGLVSCTLMVLVSLLSTRTTRGEERAECTMWNYLENKTMPLQDQGHATCTTNEECTGFSCQGVFKDAPVTFGMKVLNCQEPPGLELFGNAPQFNAFNFSHVFKHGSKYEVPGAILSGQSINNYNVSVPGMPHIPEGIPGLNIYFVVNMEPNKGNHTINIGLEVNACMNISGLGAGAGAVAGDIPGEMCILKKPLFNNTVIPVPHCEKTYAAQTLVGEPCNMNEVVGCGEHQTCTQTEPGSGMGKCECLSSFLKKSDRTCVIKEVPQSGPPLSQPRVDKAEAGGGAGMVVGGVVAVLLVVVVALLVVVLVGLRLRLVHRLRARLTNTPYEDIVIEDRARQAETIRA